MPYRYQLTWLPGDKLLLILRENRTYHCIDGVNVNHVAIENQVKGNSSYFNYTRFSIVLMALTDANCKFITAGTGRDAIVSNTIFLTPLI